MAPVEGLKFGTSGLRGLVTELVGWPAYGHALAFCRGLLAEGAINPGDGMLIGRDLRASSPEMARNCIAAVKEAGLVPVDCGALPTPALALASLERGAPAIMVTGSHIPEDRNGLKFYRADGEITKQDEAVILAGFAALPPRAGEEIEAEAGDAADPMAIVRYRQRFADFFGDDALSGLTVGVYQHSSVSRDILVAILEAAGAKTVALGRADHFIPVDTEALRDEDVALAKGWAQSQRLDAIVSTDGDADRPLIADEAGRFIRGDLVGLITALHLCTDAIVTPVTSNSAIERAGAGTVWRTRVGSPYVIAGMNEAADQGARRVVGFEANGGVLLGSTVTRDGRSLAALATRDAALPILSVLALAKARGVAVSALVASLDAAATAAHRLQNVPASRSLALLERLSREDERAAFFAEIGTVVSVSVTDGAKFTLSNGEVVHYRASGNAPELRCYAEAASQERANALLAWGLKAAARAVGASG
jgi:phosphomannomutase